MVTLRYLPDKTTTTPGFEISNSSLNAQRSGISTLEMLKYSANRIGTIIWFLKQKRSAIMLMQSTPFAVLHGSRATNLISKWSFHLNLTQSVSAGSVRFTRIYRSLPGSFQRFLRVGSPVCSSSMRAREKLRQRLLPLILRKGH